MNSVFNVFKQFDTLDQCLIDTSSLIYLSKINLLKAVSGNLRLLTVPGVIREFGNTEAGDFLELIEMEKEAGGEKTTDTLLVEAAKNFHLPVVSEDKKILMQARRFGLHFYNTLMILNFLVYKRIIEPSSYQTALRILEEEAYYDASIFEYGKMVYDRIMELRN